MAKTARLCGVLLLGLALAGPGCGALKRFGYEGFGRDAWQQPERVVDALGLEPGDRVADLGAGGGYFTFRLARAVGPQGRVFAVDVDSDMLSYLEERSAEEGTPQVEVVRAAPDDAGLAPASVDLVFTVNTYHHLPERSAYFRRLAAALRPAGRVAIVDFRPGGGFWERWLGSHATPAGTIREEMEAAGYRLATELDFLERQSFLIFEPAGP